MLTRLPPELYPATAALAAAMRHHLALTALLAGAVPGQVYANRARPPASALAWVQQRLFAVGEVSADALAATLTGEVRAQARAGGLRYLALYGAPEAEAALSALPGELARPAGPRLYFERPSGPADDWRARLPAGYTLRPVDRHLLAETGLDYLDRLAAEMCSERPSVEAFLRHSFGVCAVRGGALAGWCLSEYDHAGACEVGIEVRPEHQGRGLATALTLALAERATGEGVQRLGWHCYAGNHASAATARAAGFGLRAEYKAWVVDLGAS